MLDVYIDFKSPGSYLALEPTLALAKRTGIELQWRPFKTHERDIPNQGTDETLAMTHHRVRTQSLRDTHIKYANLRGIDLRFPPVVNQTDLALGVLSEIRGDPISFIMAAFAAYWDTHQDLNANTIVSGIISSSGVSHSGDLTGALASFQAAQAQAEALDIVNAPGYVIDQQLFIGRQHLPWIERIAKDQI